MCERMRTIADRKDKELYKTLEEKIHKRWNRLNAPLHMATYVVNPKQYDTEKTRKRVPFSDAEVARGFMACIKKIYGDREARTLIRRQFAKFLQGRKEFGTNEENNDLSMTDPIDQWTLHGTECKELHAFATRVLSQVASSSSCERNWSIYGFIHSVKRNRLTSKRVENLVFIHSSPQLISCTQDAYKEGPSKAWDVNPEDTTLDEEGVSDGLSNLTMSDEPDDQDSRVELESEKYLREMLADDVSDEDLQSFITSVDTKAPDAGDMETLSHFCDCK